MSTDPILSLKRIDGALIEAEIVRTPFGDGNRHLCRERTRETTLGQMDVKRGVCSADWLDAETSHPWLWVNWIENSTSGDRKVHGVGRALIESGIKESLSDDVCQGWMGLLAIKNAPYFYCKLGFAVLPEFDFQARSVKPTNIELHEKLLQWSLTGDEMMPSSFGDETFSVEDVCLESRTAIIQQRLRDATAALTDDLGLTYMYLPPKQIDHYRARFGGRTFGGAH